MPMLAFISPPPSPLLGTTGTELLQFALLTAAGVWTARRAGADAGRFVAAAFSLVSIFYLACPEQSGIQRAGGDLLMGLLASLQAGLMRLGGADVVAEGIAVVGSFRFTYVRGCMGLSYLAMALLCLAAQPLAARQRVSGMLALAAGMVCLNLARLIGLYGLWEAGHSTAYALFHDVGGVFFAVAAFGLYAAVLRLGISTSPAASPFAAAAPAVAPI